MHMQEWPEADPARESGTAVRLRPLSIARRTMSTPATAPFSEMPMRVADLVSSLSYALDLMEGPETMGRAMRTCLLGMRLAETMQMTSALRADLYYALLLKDAGGSVGSSPLANSPEPDGNAFSRTMARWGTLSTPSEPDLPWPQRISRLVYRGLRDRFQGNEALRQKRTRGSAIIRRMGFSEKAAEAIVSMDELWDGSGTPRRLRGEQIPMLARVVNLAQHLEAWVTRRGVMSAFVRLQRHSGSWFDPHLVQAAREMKNDARLWEKFYLDSLHERVMELDPGSVLFADSARIDEICQAFAEIIDSKTHFTFEHSNGVAAAALAIARRMGLDGRTRETLHRAALLHDIGKLGVPNAILEKSSRLSAAEWESIRLHPYYTQRILEQIPGFGEIAFIASSHHERLDGSGYYRNLKAEHLPLPARILAVADVFDALHSDRPYRPALPMEEVLRIMGKQAPQALDPDCVRALQEGAENVQPC